MDKLAEKVLFVQIYNFYSSIAHSDFAYKTYDLLIKYDAKKKYNKNVLHLDQFYLYILFSYTFRFI